MGSLMRTNSAQLDCKAVSSIKPIDSLDAVSDDSVFEVDDIATLLSNPQSKAKAWAVLSEISTAQ